MMRIAFISPWYSESMGYTENLFPKAMSKLGVEVHLITSNAQINYYSPNYDQVYKPFLGPKLVDCGITKFDNYTIHRLPYYEPKKITRGPGIKGLYKYLSELSPDIIQTFEIEPVTTFAGAEYASKKKCLFFTECHIHASVFRKTQKKQWKEVIKNWINFFDLELRLINNVTKLCYPIAEDAAEIAISHYRVPERKIKVQSLGVDTDIFFPPQKNEHFVIRNKIRQEFGFSDSDIVCIYTGRFTKDKNPQCLAKAIQILNEDKFPFKGLFIGNGTEEDIRFIKSMEGCQVGSFVPSKDLPYYYWAADIGIWPREESTSQLDAMSCGLPLVLSNNIKVVERIQGNGLLYNEGDPIDLASTIKKMIDPDIRKNMSAIGVRKINESFSWEIIARERLNDYQLFLENRQ